MKNIITKVTIAALFSMLIIACNSGSKSMFSKDNQVKFDTLNVDKKHYLNNDTTKQYCNLNVQFIYPVASPKNDLKRIQQIFISTMFGRMYDKLTPGEAVNQYVNDFIKNYEADAQVFQEAITDLEKHPNLAPQNMDEDHEHELQSSEFYSYYESLSNKVHFNQSRLLSFQVNQSNNKGSMAKYSSYNNYVISLKTGELILENDIFTPGYDVALQKLFTNSLLQQNEVKTISDLEDLGYFGIEEIMPNRNFLIDSEGITYTFNKGEYSAYPLNAPVVSLSFNEISMLLKENTVVSKLAGL
ncbi:MAG: RsiV family protein [Candidatus Saccharimonadaceae bacterium]